MEVEVFVVLCECVDVMLPAEEEAACGIFGVFYSDSFVGPAPASLEGRQKKRVTGCGNLQIGDGLDLDLPVARMRRMRMCGRFF